jgi:hypothetical protein
MNKQPVYDVDYFIRKFEAIPEENIIDGFQGYVVGVGCAYGQCKSHDGVQDGNQTPEGIALTKLMQSLPNLTLVYYGEEFAIDPYNGTPARINNGEVEQYQQPTPKQRILAALYDIKKMQQPMYEDLTKSLAILPEDKSEVDVVVKGINETVKN